MTFTKPETDGVSTPLLVRWGWLAGTAVLAALAVLYGAGLDALTDPAVPIFGDVGGHVVAIRELMGQLGRGHVHGWSYAWYGGFPLFYFYFPLPALLAVALAGIVGLGYAMTVVVVSGPLLIPLAAAVLVRATGGSRLAAFLAGAGSAYFLLVRSLAISGGSLESALVGEYSYAIAMALSLFFLASVPRLLERRTGRAMVLPALLLAATALSHVLAVFMAVVGSLAFVRRRRDLAPLASIWGIAFLISGWWSVPFLGYVGEMSSLAWSPPTTRAVAAWLFEGVPLLLLSVLALTWRDSEMLDPRMYRLVVVFLGLGIAPLLFPGLPIYPARLLPYAFWAGHVLAAVVAWQAVRALRARKALLRSTVVLLGLGAFAGVSLLRVPPRWTAWISLEGSEAAVDRDSWQRLIAQLRARPAGAVLNASQFPDTTGGHPMHLLDLHGARHIPHLTDHRIVGGLWQESSPVALYAQLSAGHLRGDMRSRLSTFDGRAPDADLGARQARILGARYIVVAGLPDFIDEYIDRGAPAGVRPLARDSLWVLYQVDGAGTALVPGPLLPVAEGEFEAAASRWFDRGGEPPVPVVFRGTPVQGLADGPRVVAGEPDLQLLPGEIRLDGVAPGQPLLLRLSYFPNWALASPGRGPFRAAPNHIMVVPRSDSVRLVWRFGWIERAGLAASILAGILVLVLSFAPTAIPRLSLRPGRHGG